HSFLARPGAINMSNASSLPPNSESNHTFDFSSAPAASELDAQFTADADAFAAQLAAASEVRTTCNTGDDGSCSLQSREMGPNRKRPRTNKNVAPGSRKRSNAV